MQLVLTADADLATHKEGLISLLFFFLSFYFFSPSSSSLFLLKNRRRLRRIFMVLKEVRGLDPPAPCRSAPES